MITERDIVRRIVAKKLPYETKVSEIMTTQLVTVDPDMSLKDAARLMSTNKIRRLPVVKQNRLVGIVVASDFVRNVGKKTVTEEILDAMGVIQQKHVAERYGPVSKRWKEKVMKPSPCSILQTK